MKSHSPLPSCASLAMCLALAITSADGALVAHYKFEETSGTTVADSSGNADDGNVVGSGSLDVTGIVGSGYEPGGSNSYGVVPNGTTNFGITGNAARTISLWFNTPNFGLSATQQNRLIGIGSGPGASFDIVAENGTNAGGVPRVGLRYGNGNIYVDADNSGTAFAANTWYHLALVYDGTTLDLESIGTPSNGTGLVFYVNGVEMNSAGGNLNNGAQTLATAGGDFFLGTGPNGTNSAYAGLLDDLQVYDSALSAAEVASLFNNPGSVIPEPTSSLLAGFGSLLLLRRRRA